MPSVIGDDDQGMGFGVQGTSASGEGVVGTHTGTAGTTAGVHGVTNSADPQARGVFGEALASAGQTVGVEGRSVSSPIGTGVVGFGSATGGFFEATGPTGNRVGAFGVGFETGVVGGSKLAGSLTTSGVFTRGGAGVLGENDLFGGVGVQGRADLGTAVFGVSSNGLAGFFDGNVSVTNAVMLSTNPPTSAPGLRNALTAANIVKAWVHLRFTIGAPTILDGF